jgi:hypothetical protein
MNDNIELDDLDLGKQQYSLEVLEKNILNFDFKRLLQTQRLSAYLCVKYILNDRYCTAEESYICHGDVLHWQKHLTRADLDAADKLYQQELEKSIVVEGDE